MKHSLTLNENIYFPPRRLSIRDASNRASTVSVLSLCFYDYLGVKNLLMHYQSIWGENERDCFDISWCRTTIEIDHHKINQSLNPVIIVVDYPGAESNWLLHKTLAVHFSRIIFLGRGKEGAEGYVYYISLNQTLQEFEKKLGELVILGTETGLQSNYGIENYDFTRREKLFVALICQGANADAIAKTMNISISTVYSYRRKLCLKMSVKNIQELILLINKSSV